MENLARLAGALWNQHAVSEDVKARDESISIYLKLIETCPPHDPHTGPFYAGLGIALWDRDRVGWTAAAARAPGQGHLWALRQGVALTGPEYPGRGVLLVTLAKALAVLQASAPAAALAAEFEQVAGAARNVVEDGPERETLTMAARVFGITLDDT